MIDGCVITCSHSIRGNASLHSILVPDTNTKNTRWARRTPLGGVATVQHGAGEEVRELPQEALVVELHGGPHPTTLERWADVTEERSAVVPKL